MAGYSGTPLAKKLGIKEKFNVLLVGEPGYYFDLFSDLPDIGVSGGGTQLKDFIHFFTRDEQELRTKLPALKSQLKKDGVLWVSWPKKASKVPTDITEDVIRQLALEIGLVDVKVCAVDETWSGLKLVIPVAKRK